MSTSTRDGARTRVLLTGHADEPTIRTHLTRAWRRHGQPLILAVSAVDAGTLLDRVARAWVTEHDVAGHRVETRWLRLAATAGVRLAVDGPPSCPGCSSPLCPNCAAAR